MRSLVVAAAIAGATITLAACSGAADNAAVASNDGALAEAAGNDAAPAPGADSTAVAANSPLDANAATAAQLGAVQGVTPQIAAAVAGGRPYASVVDLNAKLRETLSEDAANAVLVNLFVPVNLNRASREEIALIPGMTSRMVGEFLEYRPYADIDEFNREIGKYVDQAEVARFRRYVTL